MKLRLTSFTFSILSFFFLFFFIFSIGDVYAQTHNQPVTTATFSSPPDAQGEYPNPVTITLSATAAPGYLISQTYYTIDGGSQQTYTSPISVGGTGEHTITYWSVDNVGLEETPHKTNTFSLQHEGIHVDSAEWLSETTIRFHYSQNTYAPGAIGLANVLSDGTFWSGAYGWSSSQESGYVDFTAANVNDLYWGAEPGYTRYWVLVGGDFSDKSNLIRLPSYVGASHDQPVTTASLSPELPPSGEYSSAVTITLSATAAPGYLISQTYYTIDGGSSQTYTGPFSVSSSSEHTITYWSVDNVGLEETPHKSQTFTINQQHIHADSAEWLSETTIRFHYSQNAYAPGPIGLINVLSDGSFWSGAYGWPSSQESGYVDFTAANVNDLYWGAEPGYTRYYALTNPAGQSNIIRLPAYGAQLHNQPVTTATFSSAPDAQGEYPNPVTITLSATAAPGYLISQIYYTIDGGSTQTYTAPFAIGGSGEHTVTYWSVDNVGLEETPHKTNTFSLQHEGIHVDSAEWLSETTIRFHYSQNTYAPGQIGLVNVLSDGSFWSGAFGWSSSQESGYVDFTAANVNDLYWGAEPGYTRYWVLVGGDFSDKSNLIRLPVYVPNQAPVVDPFPGVLINAGETFAASSFFTDPDSTSWTATVDYGEGAGLETLTLNPDKTFNLSHQYNTSGEYTVTVVVTDDGMTTGTTMATVIVNAVPVLDTLPDETLQEGDTYTATGSFTDPDSLSWTATVDYGEGAGTQSLLLNQDNTFALNNSYEDNGTYNVTVTITDDNGAIDTETILVTVNNVNPQVGTITASVNPIQVFSSTTTTATFTDVGVLDTHTAEWDWGDGMTSPGDIIDSNGSGTVSGDHVYLAAGVYEVTLTVTDNSNASDSEIYQYLSVYNPTPQGLFNGVRKFTTPQGSYTGNPNLSGQVMFGITAKYQGTDPTGDVSMSFNQADFEFESTGITVLVVTEGNKGTLLGTGEVNGNPGYTFLVTGLDGGLGGDDFVRFQIKDAANTIVFDSQPGAGDTADPTALITAGNVVIH